VNKLVPCAWLLSGTLEIYRLYIGLRLCMHYFTMHACCLDIRTLTFRLPSFFCDIGYLPRGWWLPPWFTLRFSAWFNILLYRVIQRLIQHIFLSKMVYLDVKYMTASRNYEFLNTGTRLNANVTLYRCTILSCITILTSGLPKIIISEHM